MRDLLIATTNPQKGEEIARVLEGAPFRVLTLKDVGLADVDVEEPFDTLEENAAAKAKEYGMRAKMLTLADDTGIFVDALDGRPGVKSARYAPTPKERNDKLLDEMKDVPDDMRTARFMNAIAIFDPVSGETRTCTGVLPGKLLHEERGGRSFGYDPLFLVESLGKTYSELSLDEKNAISHRGQAAKKARDILIAEFAQN